MAAPTGQEAIVRELDRLCKAIDGFGRDLGDVKTSVAVLVERTERTDNELARIGVRVEALEKRVYIASGAAALVGMAVPYFTQIISR